MSDIAVTAAEVERVQKIAYAKRDEWEGDDDAVEMADMLIEFCDALLGRTAVDSFLRSQDMDS